jgi:hypothetical protein
MKLYDLFFGSWDTSFRLLNHTAAQPTGQAVITHSLESVGHQIILKGSEEK